MAQEYRAGFLHAEDNSGGCFYSDGAGFLDVNPFAIRIGERAPNGSTRPAEDLAEARRTGKPVSLAQAARLYGKSPRTLRAAVQAGSLRAQRVGSRRYELFADDVDAWIRAQRVESAPERALRVVRSRGER